MGIKKKMSIKEKMKTAVFSREKKERPVKCKIFKVETATPKRNVDMFADQITEFLSDGKEIVQVSQSSVHMGKIFTYITIFYKERK